MSYDDLMNDLMCLCEVRGELSPEDNEFVEARIQEIQKQLEELS